jgi:hypothetical protein
MKGLRCPLVKQLGWQVSVPFRGMGNERIDTLTPGKKSVEWFPSPFGEWVMKVQIPCVESVHVTEGFPSPFGEWVMKDCLSSKQLEQLQYIWGFRPLSGNG